MSQTNVITSFNRWFRLVGTPLFGLLLYLIIYYIDPQSFNEPSYHGPNAWQTYCIDICTALFGAYLLSESSLWTTRGLDWLMPWEKKPMLRFITQFFALVFDSVLTIGVLIWLLILLEDPNYQFTETDWLSIRQTVVFGSLMALFLNAIHTGAYFFGRWQASMLEAERLKRESVEARYEALKSQLDPHFLFNNLNTLTAIVEESPRQAVDFIENLSLVYRYILQKRNQTLVTLDEELDLANAYLYLLEKRFGDNIRAEITIPAKYRSWRLPPMTLQLLLENAVKHNIVNSSRPLHIRLTVNDPGELIVVNNRQKRLAMQTAVHADINLPPADDSHTTAPPSSPSGVGLRNIQNRYRLLGQQPPLVTETDQYFTVQLALLMP
ncbi:sensor histidine kinase [Spirosoma soli]|uniref:Sensor histidine kinase n=1 Tax=Spirosoma soli TaxID=1770529 RepID=A0ABW5M9C0_9BACT